MDVAEGLPEEFALLRRELAGIRTAFCQGLGASAGGGAESGGTGSEAQSPRWRPCRGCGGR